jgi:toxin ParE1/3/4
VLQLRWSDEAIDDLVRIVDYIESRNARAAEKLHADIVALVESICDRPFSRSPGRVSGTREALVRPNYLLVLQVSDSYLDILRVLQATQHYP